MPIDEQHPEYDAALPSWSRARDILAGEDAVKAAAEKYLPRLAGQTDEDYAAYKTRAAFFGATARTIDEYLDLVFRRSPAIALGDRMGLEEFVRDCDEWGLDWVRYSRTVVREVLSVGRAGSLVLWDEVAKRPVLSYWPAEDVINWRVERRAEKVVLVELVLRDADRLRVLKIVESSCIQEFWKKDGDGWVLEQTLALQRDGVSLSFIPFVFHGPRNSRPEPDRLPLADVICANLDHYRLDADYKHGLHFAGFPTAWVSGFDKATTLRVGSSSAWLSEAPGATAGFLEFSGSGLRYLERALEKVERRMALLGARMLEVKEGEGGDLCGLGTIVASLNQSLTRVLHIASWWIEGGEIEGQIGVSFAMNTDLNARGMSGDEITAVVGAWRSGAISRETMLERLKRGEVLPDGRSIADERALIHRSVKS